MKRTDRNSRPEEKQRQDSQTSGQAKKSRRMVWPAGVRLFLVITAALWMLLAAGCGQTDTRTAYKVLIGADAEKLKTCRNCDLLVIDAESLSQAELEELHQNGNKKIFSYLNIGSLERFRADYAKFEALTLSDYQDWPEERWVNVAEKAWQDRIVEKAKELLDKGVDGLFLDNADIYYQYPTEAIYQGILTMLKELNGLGRPLIINGGDTFVQKAMAVDDLQQLLAGVNQETVFTAIDFADGSFGRREADDKEYYQEYLKRCQQYGLTVYLLEYGAKGELAREIDEYCRQNGFFYEIADSLELNQ